MPMKINKIHLSQEELRELFYYDPLAGVLYNRITRSSSSKKGSPAGSVENCYIYVTIQGKSYPSHRIIFKMVYGRDPVEQLDHINQCRSDNRLENLREVSNAENRRNHKIDKRNKSGFTGVFFNKINNNWLAYIHMNREVIRLGRFKTFEEAKDAREEANIKYGYHENHGKGLIHPDTILPKRMISSTGEKYIYLREDTGKYTVKFRVNNEKEHIGNYESLNDAIIARDEALEKIKRGETLPKKIHSTNYKNIYFRKDTEKYRVILTIDGERKSFGSYKELNDAIKIRDEVLENNLKEAI